MAQSFKYVIVGGGNAAGYAAREFVAGGLAAGELCIITDEPVVGYERPALSKGYLAPEGAARLPGFHTCVGGGGERQTPEWYTEKGITYLTSAKVTAVDAKAKTATLANGNIITATVALILATGARAVYLHEIGLAAAGAPTPSNVHYLRNEADGASLVAAIKEAKAAGGKAVILGGGYIGLEVAAGLANNGLAVTVVCPEDRLLARLFTPQLSAFYEGFYAHKNITFVKQAAVTGLDLADGKVAAVVVKGAAGSESKLSADLVVVGVGARPAGVELVSGQVEVVAPPVGGIKVDGHMQTSVPGVYAIGDVAAFPLLRAGGALARQEHVTHARSSASHAVKAILGTASAPYDYLPYFYSRVFSLSWQFWGSSGSAPGAAQVVHFGSFDAAAPKFGAYWVEGGKVVGVFLESCTPEEAAAAKKLALEQPPAPSADELAAQGVAFATSRA